MNVFQNILYPYLRAPTRCSVSETDRPQVHLVNREASTGPTRRLTRIGERTHGELSDVMERHLPNGWTVMLSNELYRAADGEIYEGRGVPPHVRIPFLRPEDVDAGRDPMLDRVLAGAGRAARGRRRLPD